MAARAGCSPRTVSRTWRWLAVAALLSLADARSCGPADVSGDLSACTSLALGCSAAPAPAAGAAANMTEAIAAATEAAACRISQAGLAALFSGLCASGSLTSLDLRGQTLGANASKALGSALGGCAVLESLDVSDTRLGDAGLFSLLKSLPPSLRSLGLAHNGVTDEGARGLAGVFMGSALRSLDLSWNAVGFRGARGLGEALAADCALEALVLDWNALRDRGAKELGEGLKTNTKLARLSLQYNGVKDTGVTGLAAGLRLNGALKELDLSNNGVTPAAERKWRAALAAEPPAPDAKGGKAQREATDAEKEQLRARAAAAAARAAAAADDDDDVDEISFDED